MLGEISFFALKVHADCEHVKCYSHGGVWVTGHFLNSGLQGEVRPEREIEFLKYYFNLMKDYKVALFFLLLRDVTEICVVILRYWLALLPLPGQVHRQHLPFLLARDEPWDGSWNPPCGFFLLRSIDFVKSNRECHFLSSDHRSSTETLSWISPINPHSSCATGQMCMHLQDQFRAEIDLQFVTWAT